MKYDRDAERRARAAYEAMSVEDRRLVDRAEYDLFVRGAETLKTIETGDTALDSALHRCGAALERIGGMEAFHMAGAHIDPELLARIIFARQELGEIGARLR